ncbi:MAG: hemerythrin domain-containing protein [Firmicutes bacterium]|nr:hemerythrin domain-containing protein [Bacillota bacterium]
MDCFALMVNEHKNIKRMLAVMRKICYLVLRGEDVDYTNFFRIIDFVRNYADQHHHGKEETLLFVSMMEELGPVAENLVKYGMNIEHDWGRLYMQELEVAVQRVLDGDDEAKLDVIANAISYTHLLERHINKEDDVAYVYAQKNLKPATIASLNKDCARLEQEADDNNTIQKYLALLNELEAAF